MKHNIIDNRIDKVAKWLAPMLVQAGHYKDSSTATGYLQKELRARSSIETMQLLEKLEVYGLLAKQEYPLGANNIEYLQFKGIGEAKEIDSNASSWDTTSVEATELLNKTWLLNTSWEWNYEEDSKSLPEIVRTVSMRRETALDRILRGLDGAIALGNAKKKVRGLINQPTGGSNIPVKTLDYDVNNATFQAAANSGQRMFEDLAKEIQLLDTASLHHIKATHVLMSSEMHAQYALKLYSPQYPAPVLEILKKQFPGVEFVPWSRLDFQSSGLGAHRTIILNNEASNMEIAHCGPMFQEHEPETVGLKRIVGVTAKTGGLMLYRKEALRYLDNGTGDGA
jgi:hypothetical protein